jgi:PrtD family type I secretion system ABC transporter
MKSLREELRPLLGSLAALSFFMNMLLLVPAVYMLQVFDRVIPSNSKETLTVLLVGAGVALAILFCLDYVRGRLQSVLGNIIEERLSPAVVNTVVKKAARAPQTARTESIRDVAALRTMFSSQGLIALFDAPWVPIYVAVIWLFHPALGMAAGACAAIMLGLAWLNDKLNRNALDTLQSEGRRASNYVETSLRNAEVLQALGMTQSLLKRWRYFQDKVANMQEDTSKSAAVFQALTRFMRQFVQIAMLSLGAYLVLTQEASAGIMIATTVLLGRAVQPVEQLVGSWKMLSEARAAYGRLNELSRDFEVEQSHVKLPASQGRLSTENVSFRLAGTDTHLLSNVSFRLDAGESLAIIGPSAAGKSTLARLLTGVWAPTSGTVRLDGADIAYGPREDLGTRIGYVPQDVELFSGSVADNIARLGDVDSEAVVTAAKRANVHELILGMPQGYETQVGEGGTNLSPGQRQRIALARALYGDPKYLVLDEPNSNLDGAGEAALAQALGELRKQGITSIVVTHRPSLIAHVDKILVMGAGRVQQFGPAAEVMKSMQQMQVVGGGKAVAS